MGKMKKMVDIKIKFVGGFRKSEESLQVEKNITYFRLLEMLNINPETVVIVKDGLPVPTDDIVKEGEITVIRVISGG